MNKRFVLVDYPGSTELVVLNVFTTKQLAEQFREEILSGEGVVQEVDLVDGAQEMIASKKAKAIAKLTKEERILLGFERAPEINSLSLAVSNQQVSSPRTGWLLSDPSDFDV